MLSLRLGYFELFCVRATLYPLYIANARHASYADLRVRPLPAFRAPFLDTS